MLLVIILAVVEIGGLVMVIVLGVPYWGEQSLLESPKGVGGIWTAGVLVFFAYLGFDELGNLAEEMRNPERDLPRAIAIAVTASTVFYILVSISAVSLVGWQGLSGSSAPLSKAVEDILGSKGGVVLSFIALAATANTVLLLFIAASRSLYGMSKAGALP